MPRTIEPDIQEILDYVREFAASKGYEANVYDEAANRDGDWYHLPVFIKGKDLWQRIQRLQEIEDAWNNDEPRRHPRLMVVPTKD